MQLKIYTTSDIGTSLKISRAFSRDIFEISKVLLKLYAITLSFCFFKNMF